MTIVPQNVSLRVILLIAITPIWFHAIAQSKPSAGSSGKFTRLVWHDEFDHDGLPDASKWNYDTGYIRNHEKQYYTLRRIENAEIKNGLLQISARNDSFKTGATIHPVTSADLTTQGIASWTYGRMEIRVKIPSALGDWPAIWMLGNDVQKSGWPDCGELDIMEHVGYMPDTLHFNVHTEKYNHVIKTNKGIRIYYPSPEKEFHVYAIEWFPDHIDWFFDEKKVFTFQNENTGNAAWPFDKPQFLMLNLAFGGDWGGSHGVNLKALPQHFYIDYVRVFQ